jgi:hypothetical protein
VFIRGRSVFQITAIPAMSAVPAIASVEPGDLGDLFRVSVPCGESVFARRGNF